MRATFAILMSLLLASAFAAQAQDSDSVASRLSAEKFGDIEPGSYSAGDAVNFALDPYGDKYLLRFAGSPEIFVLSEDRIILGGRVLKYDTGATALRVSVWGGMTLYTETAPGGLPATRIGDSVNPSRAPVSAADFAAALNDEAAHLSYVQQLHLRFAAGPLAGDEARGLAFDALTNAEAGIERLLASVAGRQAFSHKIDTVKIEESAKSGLALVGKTLLVRFAPSQGEAGRASSRAVTVALGKLLSIPESD